MISIAYTPLIVSYTVEILPYALRAKGFTIFNFSISLSLIFNQYVNPVALEKLGWKYYIVYVAWLAFELVYVFLCEYPICTKLNFLIHMVLQSSLRPRTFLSRRPLLSSMVRRLPLSSMLRPSTPPRRTAPRSTRRRRLKSLAIALSSSFLLSISSSVVFSIRFTRR